MKTSRRIIGWALGAGLLLGPVACGSDEASPSGSASTGGVTSSAGQTPSTGAVAGNNASTGGAAGSTSVQGGSTSAGTSGLGAGGTPGAARYGGAAGRSGTGGANAAGGATGGGATASTGGVSAGGTGSGRASGGSATGSGGVAGGSVGLGGTDGGAVGVGGVSGAATAAGGSDSGALVLTSAELPAGGTFLPDSTCAGLNQSPSLSWTPGPAGTLGYAILLQDLSNSLYHWVIWNLAPTTLSLLAAIPAGTTTIAGLEGAQQRSTTQTGAYQGPCPRGTLHTYRFTLYAVDALPLPGVTTSSTPSAVAALLLQHALATATLEGSSDAARP